MSRTIDERVVSMQFDNKQFETNVRTSMNTLDKLKQSLNLTGSAKGLESISTAAKNVNLNPIGNAVETVKVKFSALEVMAVTALANITNSAVNAGKRIVSALTIQPPKDGFAEYENQINSVQTIMANTGEDVSTVNKALDELNEYADLTIYKFATMTQNAGMFTSAMGQGSLDKTMIALKGIGNWAAFAGANTQQMGNATYQLGQALSAGSIRLQDWISIEKAAGMGGAKYREEFMETARQHGVNIDAMIKKNGSFRDSLREGWLTTDIFIETLERFANDQAMTDAATKVKTFTQLVDTLKEALGTGWATTWRTIVGDYEEAKTLWTGVSDTIGKIINDSSDRRNAILEGALTSKWSKFVKKINDAGIETDKFEEKTKDVLKKHGYDVDMLIEKYGSLEQVFKNEAAPIAILKEALSGLNKQMLDLSSIEGLLKKGNIGDDVKKIQQALSDLGYDLGKWGVDGILGSATTEAIKAFQKAQGLTVDGIIGPDTIAALEKASEKTNELTGNIDELLDGVTELGGRELLIESFKNVWEGFTKIGSRVKEAWRSFFPEKSTEEKSKRLYSILDKIHSITEKFTENLEKNGDKITRTFKGIFAIVDLVKTVFGGGFRLAFKTVSAVLKSFDLDILDVTATIGDALSSFRDWVFESGVLSEGLKIVVNTVRNFGLAIYEWGKSIYELPQVQKFIDKFGETITDTFGKAYNKILEFIDLIKNFGKTIKLDDGTFKKIGFKDIGEFFKTNVFGVFEKINFKTIFDNIVNALRNFKNSAGTYLDSAGEKFDEIKSKIVDFVDFVKDKLGNYKGAITALGTLLAIILILNKIKKTVSGIASGISGFLGSFSGIGEAIKGFFESLKGLSDAKADAIKKEALGKLIESIAKSLLMLSAAIFIISKIPKEDLQRSIGVIGIMAGVVLAMMTLAGLISKIGKDSTIDTAKFGSMMASIGIALLLMSASIKILGGMKPDELKQGGIAVASFLGIMTVMMLATRAIGKNNIAQFGKMMRKLATALLLLAAVVYIFGSMDTKTLIQGGLAITAFLMIMSGMMAMTKDISENSKNFGKMIRNISFSLLMLAGVVYIFGSMDTKTLIKGGLAVVTFVGLMIVAMGMTSSISGNVDKFGKMMLSISAGLLLMALSVKILGNIDTRALAKGALVITAFSGIIMGLMAATSLMGKYSFNAGKMGLLILSFSASILLMTASIAALSMIDGDGITNAIRAIAGIGLIFSALIAVTKFAKNVKMGTLIGLSVAIGILAASVAALSFIPDTSKLAAATGAISVLLGVFAGVLASTKFVNSKAIATLIIMGGMVGVLAWILKDLANGVTDTNGALKVAIGLSAVVLTLSGACALISEAGKGADFKSVKMGLLLFAGLMTVLGIVSWIAISQLPNIAKKLSEFMEELKPFITGLNSISGVDSSTISNIKSISEAMFVLAGAGSKYAITDSLTGGGVRKAFDSFSKFIKEVLPAIKDLALDVSGEGVSINMDNLNAIIGAVGSLAEAASKAPSITVGFGAGLFGIGAYISIPKLTEFTKWMTEAVPLMKDLALELSGEDVEINTTNLNAVIDSIKVLSEAASNVPTTTELHTLTLLGVAGYSKFTDLDGFKTFIEGATKAMSGFAGNVKSLDLSDTDIKNIRAICETVKLLAEAADAAPSVELAGAFSKFVGGVGYISYTDLNAFGSFISSVSTSMPTFAGGVKDLGLTESDLNNITAICETVKLLAEAADAAPSVELAGAFSKFVGGGGYIKIPLLTSFTTWITKVIPEMTKLASKIKGTADGQSIDTKDISSLTNICKAVKILAEAAGELPSYEAAVLFNGIIGNGGYVKIPALFSFISWIKAVIPIMSGFAVTNIREPGITETEANTLKTICKAVEYLGVAAGSAPSIEAGLGFAKFGMLKSAGFGVGASIPLLTEFKDWIAQVIPIMSGFTIDVKEAGITADDVEPLKSICQAIEYLGTAAGSAPSAKAGLGFAKFGLVTAFGGGISIPLLTQFKDWIAQVVPIMSGFTIDAKEAGLTEEDGKAIASICEAVTILGEAAASGAPETKLDFGVGGFGGLVAGYVSVTSTDLDSFTTWIESISKEGGALDKLIGVSKTEFTSEDGVKIQTICQGVQILAEAARFAPKKDEYKGIFGSWVSEADVNTLIDWVDKIIPSMDKMAKTLSESSASIDTSKLLSVTTSLKNVAEAMFNFSTAFNIEYIDMDTLKMKVEDLGDCMVSFSGKVAEVNTSAISSASTAAKNICDVLTALTKNEEGGNVWMTFDSATFKTKALEIGDAMIAFGDKMEGVNISSSTAQASALTTIIAQLSAIEYSGVDDFVAAIDKIATANFDGFKEGMSKLDGISSAGAELVSSLASGIEDNAGDITVALRDALATAAAGITDSSSSFTTAGGKLIVSLSSGIKKGENIAKLAAIYIGTSAAKSAGSQSVVNAFINAGGNVATGFAKGIKLKTYVAKEAAKYMARQAIAQTKATIDSASPSKVFRKIGQYVPEGFALGIDDLGGMVKKSSKKMAENAIKGTSDAISRISDAIDSDIDAQPTIRPVLDLTDIETNARRINGLLGTPSIATLSNVGAINRMMSNHQNGVNDDVISAIDNLGRKLGNISGDTYQINGITYDDGSNVSDAVKTLIRAARVERRK